MVSPSRTSSFQYLPQCVPPAEERGKSNIGASRQHLNKSTSNAFHYILYNQGFVLKESLELTSQLMLCLCRPKEKNTLVVVWKAPQGWGISLLFTVQIKSPRTEPTRKHEIRIVFLWVSSEVEHGDTVTEVTALQLLDGGWPQSFMGRLQSCRVINTEGKVSRKTHVAQSFCFLAFGKVF